MLQIKYDRKRKDVFSEWSEITIKEFHGLYQIMHKYEDVDLDGDTTQKLLFMRDYVSYLLKEPPEYVEMMNTKHIEKLVAGTHNLLTDFKHKELRMFDFEGETYFFPTDNMRASTFGEFIEISALDKSTEFLKNGKFDVVAEQMARICKRADEMDVYLDEEVVKERAEKFQNLTMNIVWEFCFFLLKQQNVLAKIFQTFGEGQQEVMNPKEQGKSLNLMDG